jgi:transposase
MRTIDLTPENEPEGKDLSNIVTLLSTVQQSAQPFMPEDMQKHLTQQLCISDHADAAPAGAVLTGVYILDYLGFARYADDQLGVEHTSLEQLREHYRNREDSDKPMVPSTGIILSLLVADMVACPRNFTSAHKFVEMAQRWQTGPLLGIDPLTLNDDRIGRALSVAGSSHQKLEEILINLVVNAGKKLGIPLSKFILDTTNLQLDGKFKDADKVVPGRGKDSFSQLIISLVIVSGVRMPAGFGVLPGNTSDSKTLQGAYKTVNRVADPGSVEFLMDRAFPTASNLIFLKEKESERHVNFIGPLKMGLSEKKVRELIDQADRESGWKSIGYRSTKETLAKIAPPMTAYDTTWILTEKIKPDLEPGQKRRPKGSVQQMEIKVRCVFYRHEGQAERDRQRRQQKMNELEQELTQFQAKLNKNKYRELSYCQNKLTGLVKTFSSVSDFVNCTLTQSEAKTILLDWSRKEEQITAEERYDGIFALLTNYSKEQVNANQLVTRYRSRDEVEVDFKAMRGILDLERVLFRRPERIDAYIFLKVIALFVLAFLRSYAERESIKTTEKKIQESLGDLLLVQNKILPLDLNIYSVGRDCEITQLFRKLFCLPDPLDLIKVLGRIEAESLDDKVKSWYEAQLKSVFDSS